MQYVGQYVALDACFLRMDDEAGFVCSMVLLDFTVHYQDFFQKLEKSVRVVVVFNYLHSKQGIPQA